MYSVLYYVRANKTSTLKGGRLLIGASLGLQSMEVLEKLCGTSVYLDTSLSAIRRARSAVQGQACGDILRAHDPSRILFATDTPWSDPAAEIAFVRSAGLPEEITEMVLHKNAETLLASCVQ